MSLSIEKPYNGWMTPIDRCRELIAKADRWLDGLLAGAIEADLRDAGYEVLGRTETGRIVWRDPANTAVVAPATPRGTSTA